MYRHQLKSWIKLITAFTLTSLIVSTVPAGATDSAHQKYQKAELKQILLITGNDSPCAAWAQPLSANGYTWILVTTHSRVNGNCNYAQNPTYRLIKETNNQFNTLRLSDIGINDSRNISIGMNGIVLKVDNSGFANILWNNNGQPALTVVATDNTSKTFNLNKYGCSEGSSRVDLTAKSAIITWAPKHQNPDPNKIFCDALIQMVITGNEVEYIRTSWGDLPPEFYSADFSQNKIATRIIQNSLYTCAVRSYPVDQYIAAGPQYSGVYLAKMDLITNVTKMNIVTKSSSEGFDCALMSDVKNKEGAIVVSRMAKNIAGQNLSSYNLNDDSFERPVSTGDLGCSESNQFSFGYPSNQIYIFCSAGMKNLIYENGILQTMGPGESLFSQSIDDGSGNSLFFGSNLVSGSMDENGAMKGFSLLYINYKNGQSAIERGNIELFRWCDPAQTSPNCKLGNKVYQRATVTAAWNGNQPAFYVFSTSGNELAFSKVLNSVLETPSSPSLQSEIGPEFETSLTAYVESDGRSPILEYRWEVSFDNFTWSKMDNETNEYIRIPKNTLSSSTFYRAIATNSLGQSPPSKTIEIKGQKKEIKVQIKCIKGIKVKLVSGVSPVCPKGYKRK